MPRRWLLLWRALLPPAARVLSAEEESGREEPRFYIGGLFANCTVLGDFTGDLVLSDGYQLFDVPEVGDGGRSSRSCSSAPAS
jgi:hypothetical protein